MTSSGSGGGLKVRAATKESCNSFARSVASIVFCIISSYSLKASRAELLVADMFKGCFSFLIHVVSCLFGKCSDALVIVSTDACKIN